MSGLRIITADERLARKPKINIAVFGPSGVGKTTLARTLDPDTTLFLDGEAGTLALGDWRGRVVDLRGAAASLGQHPWVMCRAIASLLAGPDPADTSGPYSAAAYEQYKGALGDPAALFKGVDTLFMDSITVASRWAFEWCQMQPEAFSEKTGKPDTRGAYGLLGREMTKWLTVLQHAPYSVIVVGIMDEDKDDLGRITYQPQIVGSSTGRALPGIFDTVLTLSRFDVGDGGITHNMIGGTRRALVCDANPWGLLAKNRSGNLDTIEPPNLGELVRKMRTAPRHDATLSSSIATPAAPAAA
jgi:hypothetical protein